VFFMPRVDPLAKEGCGRDFFWISAIGNEESGSGALKALKFDCVFSFGRECSGEPWTLTPSATSGDLGEARFT